MTHNIEYNSQKENLTISEYGRNVQNLINYARTIEDDKKRQETAEEIVDLMHRMNPIHRNNQEYKEKLWRHFFRIAEFDIKVTPPDGEVPNPESSRLKPDTVEYPNRDYAYKHYGNNVKTMIIKAKAMEDKEKQAEYAEVIGAYMKLAYRTWSREHYVSDDIVKEDIKRLSEGVLTIPEEVSLDYLANKVKQRNNKQNNSRNNNHRGRRPKHNNNRRRR